MPDLHRPAPAWFDRLAFVLVRPTHPGNVGAVARAMRTMGLRRLVVVAPRDPAVLTHPEAVARASGADDVLREARLAKDLDAALAPFTLAVAVSAEPREFGPAPLPPEAAVHEVREALLATPREQAALVFGTERTGLSVQDVQACQRMCSIPGVDDYHSLNLAQAAQIVAYCLRAIDRLDPPAPGASSPPELELPELAVSAAPQRGLSDNAAPQRGLSPSGAPQRGLPASLDQIEALFAHLETALVRIGFLDPAHPKKLMPRLRRLFGRTRLEAEEVALLRGVCTQIEKLADGDIHAPSRSRRHGEHSAATSETAPAAAPARPGS